MDTDRTADGSDSATRRKRTAAPALGAQRLLLVGTGAVAAMHLPFWLNWMTANYPDLQIQVVLTPSAQRFVTRDSMTLLTRREALSDRWRDEPEVGALHARLLEWADSVLVYPAAMNFLSRLANGLADTPATLALQCTNSIPIALAPSLPPGASDNPVLAHNLRRLAERPNIVIAPTQPATSVTTGRRDAAGAAPMWTLIELLESCRQRLRDGSKPTAVAGDGAMISSRMPQPSGTAEDRS